MDTEIKKRQDKLKKFFFGWIKDNYDKVFLAILIAAFLIRLWIFFKTMHQPLWWDEADYLSTGKNWGLGLGVNDIWYYRRGFLFPLISALFFRVGFGEIGIRFLMVLFSTGIVAVSYFLISKMFNKKLAVLTTIGLSASWIILLFTGRVLTDIPAAFFLLLALFFFWKGYVLKEGNKFLYLFAGTFALAVLTRMQSLLFVPLFLVYIIAKERTKVFKNKQLWISLGIFSLLLLPHFILYFIHYGNPFADMSSYYLKIGDESATAQRSFAIFNYFKDIPNMLTTPIFVILIFGSIYFFGDLIIGLDKSFKDKVLRNKLFSFLWVVTLFLFIGYITAHSYVEQRYIIAGLPFLFLIAFSPFLLIKNISIKYLHLKKATIMVLIFLAILLLLIPNLLLANSFLNRQINSYSQVKQAGELMKLNSNPGDIIISTSVPQITYYSERSTYPYDILNYSIHQGDIKSDYMDGEEGFMQFLLDKKPRFLMASSVFEEYPEWILLSGQKEGYRFIIMPFFNSSIVYDSQTNQMVSLDLKGEIKKENMTLRLFYPKTMEEINGIFIYEVEYN